MKKNLLLRVVLVVMLCMSLSACATEDPSESKPAIKGTKDPRPTATVEPTSPPFVGPREDTWDTDENTTDEVTDEPGAEPTVKPTPMPSIVDMLPAPDSLNPEKTPMLYDFVAGCLDYHIPVHRDQFTSDFYILRNTDYPSVLHNDWYVVQTGFTTPPLGSKINSMELTPELLESFESLVSELPEERYIVEGDWELFLLTVYDEEGVHGFDADGKWGDLELRMFSLLANPDYTSGYFKKTLESGAGWPTEWLRQPFYADRMMHDLSINIWDPWWDTWSYRQRYDIVQTAYNNGIDYWVICTGKEEFLLCDSTGGSYPEFRWWDLRVLCNDMGYDIVGMYTHDEWQPYD